MKTVVRMEKEMVEDIKPYIFYMFTRDEKVLNKAKNACLNNIGNRGELTNKEERLLEECQHYNEHPFCQSLYTDSVMQLEFIKYYYIFHNDDFILALNQKVQPYENIFLKTKNFDDFWYNLNGVISKDIYMAYVVYVILAAQNNVDLSKRPAGAFLLYISKAYHNLMQGRNTEATLYEKEKSNNSSIGELLKSRISNWIYNNWDLKDIKTFADKTGTVPLLEAFYKALNDGKLIANEFELIVSDRKIKKIISETVSDCIDYLIEFEEDDDLDTAFSQLSNDFLNKVQATLLTRMLLSSLLDRNSKTRKNVLGYLTEIHSKIYNSVGNSYYESRIQDLENRLEILESRNHELRYENNTLKIHLDKISSEYEKIHKKKARYKNNIKELKWFNDYYKEKVDNFNQYLALLEKAFEAKPLSKSQGDAIKDIFNKHLQSMYANNESGEKVENLISFVQNISKYVEPDHEDIKNHTLSIINDDYDIPKNDKVTAQIQKALNLNDDEFASYYNNYVKLVKEYLDKEKKEKEEKEKSYPEGTVLFGGHDRWQKFFAQNHPEVKVIDGTKATFTSNIINPSTPLLLLNTTHMKHSVFNKIRALANRYGVPTEYVYPRNRGANESEVVK